MSATTLMFDFNRLPEQWRAFTQQALAAWKADTFSVRRPLSGKSGAAVMLVDIRTSIFEGQAILKLSNGGPLAEEGLRQEQARQISPSIAARIPSTPHQHVDGSRSAMLMTVAGHGLLETEVLANAKGQRLNIAVQMISESLLTEFNPAPSSSPPLVGAGALLADWLEHRLGPKGRIPEMMRRLLSLPDSCDSFRYGGIDYPNPYGFARADFSGNRIELLPALGNVHGDLHSENILVGGQLTLRYYYIDFAFLRTNAGLLFDHCYLELHLLFVQRETTTYDRWSRLCQSLNGLTDTQAVASNLVDQEDHGILWTVGMLRAAIHRWIRNCFPERSEDLKKQLLLARIAAGLNFANKLELADDHALSGKKKVFAFLYAATAARELFDYCRTPVREDGPLARPEQDIPPPTGTAWRAVWRECGGFNDREAAYILIAGSDLGLLPEDIQSQFGRLPWSLVIDFDSTVSHQFASIAGDSLRPRRGVHLSYPHQSINLDFEAATCWFFAEPGPTDTLGQWRQQTLPGLRVIAGALMRATVPRPTCLVVLGGRMDLKKLEYTVTTLEDQFAGALRIMVVSNDADDTAYRTVVQGSQKAQNLACNWRDLGLGIHEMFGDLAEQPGIWIPFRDPSSKVVSRIQIDAVDLAVFSETVEIVPAGPVNLPQSNAEPESADFLHGNTITSRELDLHLDVDRDVVRGPNGALQRLRTLLAAVPADSFAIEHTPGAGGTTISRRIAWELRDEYPCLVLKTLSNNTYDVIERLFQKSNLPILLVAEAARLPGTQRELLFNVLKGRGLRFVILDVRRRRDPRDTDTSLAVVDPMPFGDAQRFLQQYERKAPESRRQALRDLADRPDFAPYRSPFFFGFYAFECDFVRVPGFVQSLLADLPQEARRVLAHLALIRRYSQEKLPVAALRLLLGLPAGSDGWEADSLLSGPLKRIVMFDGRNVSVLHPRLAEEIIRQHLQPSNSQTVEAWRVNLGDFCIGFIQQMANETLRASTVVVEILTDICIERGIRRDSLTAQTFSDLLNDLRSAQAQRRVLEALCEHFPDSGHFWNHLGRHISIQESGSFEEAKTMLQRAIELEPNDDVHQHGLGMIYRKEVRRILQEPLAPEEPVMMRFNRIRPLFARAEECFARARELNPDSQYPLVTPIQMIIETIERLARLGNQVVSDLAFRNAPDEIAEWCRAQIGVAQALLAQLHHLEANIDPGPYRKRCESELQGILGNFDGMVRGLTELLRRPDVAPVPIRRILANAFLRRIEPGAGALEPAMLRRVVELMEQNIAANPTNGHDVRMWFRAYRMLPDFTLVRALEKVTYWAINSDDIDAKYYLYILHFVAARANFPRSGLEARKYIELCRRQAPVMQSKKSFEWWASPALGRSCPLVHHSELGRWSKAQDFFEGVEKLGVVEGRIDEISSAQAGVIEVSGMSAFFAPRNQFYRARDLNAKVSFYLGFSYEGLRAWNVRHLAH